MHGHPFPGPVQLWWGRGDGAERPRNLFFAPGSRPRPQEMFSAGGLITADGQADREPVIELMGQLMRRMKREQSLPPAEPEGAPPNGSLPRPLPSGYTYLLQLIAHDMVDSVVSFTLSDGGVGFGTRNARVAPLVLDTLYGLGPEESPQAYAYIKPAGVVDPGRIPRTRLSLGPELRRPPDIPPGMYQPFRDVARSSPAACPVSDGQKRVLSEVMLADPRNDGHALISQLTVVFQLLHNRILGLVEAATDSDDGLRELAFRRFQCARLVTTLIYRNVVEKDVLRWILDGEIYDRYTAPSGIATAARPPFDGGEGVPLEFAFGAFRFGHALVRERYAINRKFGSEPIKGALNLSSVRRPEELPIDETKANWLVDWAYFFEIDGGPLPNRAMAFAPAFSPTIESQLAFAPDTDLKPGGLGSRDLVSAAFAGMLSVPELIRLALDKGFATVEPFAAWRPRLERWLTEHPDVAPPADSVRRIADDPPLPFFVLFEAARIGRPDQAEGGRRLGPLGSIVVAEAILGAMRRHPLGVEAPGSTLKERIAGCAALFDEDRAKVERALSAVGEIASMPDLLRYLFAPVPADA